MKIKCQPGVESKFGSLSYSSIVITTSLGLVVEKFFYLSLSRMGRFSSELFSKSEIFNASGCFRFETFAMNFAT